MTKATTIEVTMGPDFERLVHCTHLAGRGILAIGPTGVAKTAHFQSVARKLNIGYRRLDASVIEASDIGGIPYRRRDKMRYARPFWMPSEEDTKGGILVIEEATRPNPDVRNALLNLISEKSVNGHLLPPGWTIHGTANPANNDYVDADQLDLAFAARFSVVNVRASAQHWVTWAKRNHVNEQVISFVQTTPDIFDGKLSNPRAWTAVSDFLTAAASDKMTEDNRPDKNIILAFIAGYVGPEMASRFMSLQRTGSGTTISGRSLLVQYRLQHRHIVQAMATGGHKEELARLVGNVELELRNHPLSERSESEATLAKENLALFINDLHVIMPTDGRRLTELASRSK